MSRFRRVRIQGGSYFFTVNLHDRSSSLLTDEYTSLAKSVKSVKQRFPFKLHGWVVLPDHLHCIWTLPDNDSDYSGRWREIKKMFTRFCRENDMEVPRQIWQPRFWEHTIRNQTDMRNHLAYIHVNPIKHGYVHRVRDWPYSSFHYYVRTGRYSLDWGGDVQASGVMNPGEKLE